MFQYYYLIFFLFAALLRFNSVKLRLPDVHEPEELLRPHVGLGRVALPAETCEVLNVVADLALAEGGLRLCMVQDHLIEGQDSVITNNAQIVH